MNQWRQPCNLDNLSRSDLLAIIGVLVRRVGGSSVVLTQDEFNAAVGHVVTLEYVETKRRDAYPSVALSLVVSSP